MYQKQTLNQITGAVHAAGWLDSQRGVTMVREDVGRHNAVDKVLGRAFLDATLPASDRILVLSGRAGFELIQKAVALAPGDPFIIDSLGWVEYRLGRLKDAEHNLQDAYDRQPDPEIAAHLGQVLWAQGNKDAATRLWQASYKANPDSEALKSAIEQHAH